MRVLIAGGYDTRNLGDYASWLGLKKLLNKEFGHVVFTVLSRHPGDPFAEFSGAEMVKNFDFDSRKESEGKFFRGFNLGDDQDHLVKINEVQGLDILDKLQQIETKKQEVAALEQRIDDVSAKAKESIASSYMAHAKSVEDMANRTRFAPKKKKATIMQSIELYRKAALYGNAEANNHVARLEQELK